MNIPMTRFEGFLRCIRLSDLDELSRDALEFVCQHFFGRDIVNEEGISSNEKAIQELGLLKKLSSGGHESPFAYRRFAGDPTLPRSRYYSVANDEHGDDGGTLAAELGAYSDLKKAGPVWIHDTLTMDIGPLAYFWQFRRREFKELPEFIEAVRGSIIFHFDYKKTNVSFDFADSHIIYTQAARFNFHEFAVFIPTTVTHVTYERCIDLRRPNTQQALVEFLDEGVPGIFMCDKLGNVTSLDISGAACKSSKTGTISSVGDPSALVYGPSPLWDGEDSEIPPGLPRLLAYLTYAQRGGSPLIDAVARRFRAAGVDATIFPSARCDVRVDIQDGSLQRWGGWNLVDYRNAPSPHSKASLIVEPQSWMNPLGGYKLSMPSNFHKFAGSFTLEGPTQALHSYLEASANENDGV